MNKLLQRRKDYAQKAGCRQKFHALLESLGREISELWNMIMIYPKKPFIAIVACMVPRTNISLDQPQVLVQAKPWTPWISN